MGKEQEAARYICTYDSILFPLATKATMDITPQASQAEAMQSTKIKLALEELNLPEQS
jgi:hypothetical protein